MIDRRRELELRACQLSEGRRDAFIHALRARLLIQDASWSVTGMALIFVSESDIKAALDFIGEPKPEGGGE